MRPIIAFVSCFVLAGCGSTRPPATAPPASASPSVPVLIKDREDDRGRDDAVGKWVRLEGVVTNTKQPQIAGIDVDEPTEPIPGSAFRKVIRLRDQRGWAEGVLERTIVRPEDVDDTTANRGAGTFYRLVDPRTGHTAEAHPVLADRQ